MGIPRMSFSNRMTGVKGKWLDRQNAEAGVAGRNISKLHIRDQVWEVAEDWLVAIDCTLYCGAGARQRRSERWRGEHRHIRHFGDADISGEADDIEPICNGKIGEGQK